MTLRLLDCSLLIPSFFAEIKSRSSTRKSSESTLPSSSFSSHQAASRDGVYRLSIASVSSHNLRVPAAQAHPMVDESGTHARLQHSCAVLRHQRTSLVKLVSKFEILDAMSTVEAGERSRPSPLSSAVQSRVSIDNTGSSSPRHWPSLATVESSRSSVTDTGMRSRGTSVAERRKIFEGGNDERQASHRVLGKSIIAGPSAVESRTAAFASYNARQASKTGLSSLCGSGLIDPAPKLPVNKRPAIAVNHEPVITSLGGDPKRNSELQLMRGDRRANGAKELSMARPAVALSPHQTAATVSTTSLQKAINHDRSHYPNGNIETPEPSGFRGNSPNTTTDRSLAHPDSTSQSSSQTEHSRPQAQNLAEAMADSYHLLTRAKGVNSSERSQRNQDLAHGPSPEPHISNKQGSRMASSRSTF